VEHGFQGVWQRYARALRQRNTLHRAGAERAEAAPWERELVESGLEIDGYRRRYLAAIEPMLARLGESLLGSGEAVGVEYQQGWPVASDLADTLARNWARDQQAGSTQAGPHRADLAVRVGSHKVQDRVSRGQQKVLAGALILAQLAEFQRRTGRRAALLADDLPGHVELRRSTDVPVAIGENVHTEHRFREWLVAGACDIVQPNIVRVGGITPFLRIAEVVRDHGATLAPHLLLDLSGQLAVSLPDEVEVEDVEDASFAALGALAGPSPVAVADGWLTVGDHVGLGLRFVSD
jgi:hypothetical protein